MTLVSLFAMVAGCSADDNECGIAFVDRADGQDVTHVVLQDESGALAEEGELTPDGRAVFDCSANSQVTLVHEFTVPIGETTMLVQTFADLQPGEIVSIGPMGVGEPDGVVEVSTRAAGISPGRMDEVYLVSGCAAETVLVSAGASGQVSIRCPGKPGLATVLAFAGTALESYFAIAPDIQIDGAGAVTETGGWAEGEATPFETDGIQPRRTGITFMRNNRALSGYLSVEGHDVVPVPPPGIANGLILTALTRLEQQTDHIAQWVAPDAPVFVKVSDPLPFISGLQFVEGPYGGGVSIALTEASSEIDMTFARFYMGSNPTSSVIWDIRGGYRETVTLPELPASVPLDTDRDLFIGEFHYVAFDERVSAGDAPVEPDNYRAGFLLRPTAEGVRVRESIFAGGAVAP